VTLTVVVPMLDEERAIAATLRALRAGAPDAEIVVVDGGSSDGSVAIAGPLADAVISAPRGRASQMNAGAAASQGGVLAFVHADTIVPTDFAQHIQTVLDDAAVVGGHFDVVLDNPSLVYRLLGALISWRSRLMRSATGDQAIFVRREVFERLGGFAQIDLCEDLDFARRLRRAGRIARADASVLTSARRWRSHGMARTILRMWTIKSLFLLGVSPRWLKRHYLDAR
jgi:rSAM/selenodomain-associated transferase 2